MNQPASPNPAFSTPRLSADVVVALGLTLLAIACRLLPHPPNFTPVAAVALFAGAALGRRWAVGIPLIAMLASDWILGFHPYMPAVYMCLLLNVFLGRWLVGSQRAWYSVLAASLVGSTTFFLATNFACWMAVYEPTWAGLARCYTLALPFFRNTIAGDLFYSATLFGCFAFAQQWTATSAKHVDQKWTEAS